MHERIELGEGFLVAAPAVAWQFDGHHFYARREELRPVPKGKGGATGVGKAEQAYRRICPDRITCIPCRHQLLLEAHRFKHSDYMERRKCFANAFKLGGRGSRRMRWVPSRTRAARNSAEYLVSRS